MTDSDTVTVIRERDHTGMQDKRLIREIIAEQCGNTHYVSSIPSHAVEQREPPDRNSASAASNYYVDGLLVGRRVFHSEGALLWEYGLRDGKYHGHYYYFHENSHMQYRCRYASGKANGVAAQWDEDGTLICISLFEDGTGMDLWCTYSSQGKTELSEERHYAAGLKHGPERWWDSESTVWREEHFSKGLRHGVFREWEDGKMAKGFPRYFTEDQEVTRAMYLKTCSQKPETGIPEVSEHEDTNQRTLPEFYRLQQEIIQNRTPP